jgi:Leucine-rich repeat (LRR) protein
MGRKLNAIMLLVFCGMLTNNLNCSAQIDRGVIEVYDIAYNLDSMNCVATSSETSDPNLVCRLMLTDSLVNSVGFNINNYINAKTFSVDASLYGKELDYKIEEQFKLIYLGLNYIPLSDITLFKNLIVDSKTVWLNNSKIGRINRKESKLFKNNIYLNLGVSELVKVKFVKNYSIKELHLEYNKFKKIPRSIKKLKNLEVLNISGNWFNYVNVKLLKKLKKLKTLYIYDTPMSAPNLDRLRELKVEIIREM